MRVALLGLAAGEADTFCGMFTAEAKACLRACNLCNHSADTKSSIARIESCFNISLLLRAATVQQLLATEGIVLTLSVPHCMKCVAAFRQLGVPF